MLYTIPGIFKSMMSVIITIVLHDEKYVKINMFVNLLTIILNPTD